MMNIAERGALLVCDYGVETNKKRQTTPLTRYSTEDTPLILKSKQLFTCPDRLPLFNHKRKQFLLARFTYLISELQEIRARRLKRGQL